MTARETKFVWGKSTSLKGASERCQLAVTYWFDGVAVEKIGGADWCNVDVTSRTPCGAQTLAQLSTSVETLLVIGVHRLHNCTHARTHARTRAHTHGQDIWQLSIFGCWSPGMELPATGGYVGTVSDSLPDSTQNVSVYWVICYSAHMTFLCLTYCL